MSSSSSGNCSLYGNHKSNNRVKSKSSLGWAAFDQKQKHKIEHRGHGADLEPYPSLLPGSGPAKLLPNGKKAVLEKPFSSVVVATTNFPSLMDAPKHGKDLERGAPVANTAQMINSDVSTEAYQKLKHFHSWADETLIRDVLAGVNYNTEEALSLLEAMRMPDGEAENKNVDVDSTCGSNTVPSNVLSDSVGEKYAESEDVASSLLLNGTTTTRPPIEPEFDWEEDDLYLIHRREAIKMMRSASRHSTAANDAFLRGDHVSAHLFSIKAREEWTAAEKLNAKAAMEILNLRNNNNDPWTLDLHGLHAGEAVEALKERLQKVESVVVSSNDSAIPTGYQKDSSLPVSSSAESLLHVNMEKLERQHPSLRQRPMLLQVITGKGNHSRGEAALPPAIRNFLNENGYHFDATRPGVVMVRPKFRQQRRNGIIA